MTTTQIPGGNEGPARAECASPSCPLSGVALVVGSAAEAWDDLDRAHELVESPTIIAINDVIADCERDMAHGVTLHPEKLVGEFHPAHNPDEVSWYELRRERGYNTDYDTWSRRNPRWVDHILPHWGGGSSGLYGVTVAMHLGWPRIILCGVPMTVTPHYDGATGTEGPTGDWDECEIHRPHWKSHRHRLMGTVKSMSGWTRELLGAPSVAWLTETAHAPS